MRKKVGPGSYRHLRQRATMTPGRQWGNDSSIPSLQFRGREASVKVIIRFVKTIALKVKYKLLNRHPGALLGAIGSRGKRLVNCASPINCSAFTFIELLVALSLAMVICGGLCSLSLLCINFYQTSQLTMRQLCGTELVLDALRRDCLSAHYEQPWIGCGILVVHRMNPQGVCQPVHVRWTVEPEGVRRMQGLFDPQLLTWSNITHYHVPCSLKTLSVEPIYHQRGHVCALAIKYQRAPDTDQQQSTVVLANRIEYYD